MFNGVFCPIVTLFRADGSIDYLNQGRLVERLIAQGVDGILFCGSIGEFPSLTLPEKRDLFAWAVEKVNGRVKVLAGTGGTCVSEVVALTEYCRNISADGAVVISPYYFALNERALHDYYAAVADVGLPVILYNFPGRTQVSLSPALVAKLASEYETIVGIKDTVDSMSHTREVISAVRSVRADFSVLSGYDEYFIPNLMSGGDGVLSGLTNVAPGVFAALKGAYCRRAMEEVVDLQRKLNFLMKLYALTDPFVSAIKWAVHTVIPEAGEYTRPPFAPIAEHERKAVEEVLRWFI